MELLERVKGPSPLPSPQSHLPPPLLSFLFFYCALKIPQKRLVLLRLLLRRSTASPDCRKQDKRKEGKMERKERERRAQNGIG